MLSSKGTRRLIVTVKALSAALFWLTPLTLLGFWAYLPALLPGFPQLSAYVADPSKLTPAVQFMGFCISMLPAGIFMYAMRRLYRLFSAYQRGDIFSRQNAGHLFAVAVSLLALTVAKPVASTLLSVALSWRNPEGQRMLSISLGSHDLELLLVALVFLTISLVMREAHRLDEENKSFI